MNNGEYEMPSPATRPEDDPYSVGREERLTLAAQAGGGEPDLYIVSLQERDLMRHRPYITVWRPECAGYAYPLSWAGKYTRAEVRESPGYLNNGDTTIAVPCAVLDAMAEAPRPGMIDGNAGPVVRKTPKNLQLLKAARWLP